MFVFNSVFFDFTDLSDYTVFIINRSERKIWPIQYAGPIVDAAE
jgi:hypothetical protein